MSKRWLPARRVPPDVGQAEALAGIRRAIVSTWPSTSMSPSEVVPQRMLARGREDDTPESIARRLELYEAETAPLLAGAINEHLWQSSTAWAPKTRSSPASSE